MSSKSEQTNTQNKHHCHAASLFFYSLNCSCFTKCHGLVAMPASCWPWWLYKRQPLYLRHNHLQMEARELQRETIIAVQSKHMIDNLWTADNLRYFIAFINGHYASWSEPSWFSYHSKWKFKLSLHIKEFIFYFLALRDITSATEKYPQ